MAKQWTAEDISSIASGFQPACVLAAAAELDMFGAVADAPATAEAMATKIGADVRATTMLADALTAMELLCKDGRLYRPAPGVAEVLTEAGGNSMLAMVRLQANCLRSWAQLAKVTQTGRPTDRQASIRGAEADHEAFIEAMNDFSRPVAEGLVEEICPHRFSHLLDLGGGPGTWTIAFLRTTPAATATLFDLPEVIPIARRHIAAAGLTDRVTLAAGNFDTDETLPKGADLAWVSAIVHMNSPRENRGLFAKVHAALADGGQILIRDVVMDASRTSPPMGAFFAINMLVHTPGGGTYTFEELSENLVAAGFADPVLLRTDQFMNSVIAARKI